MTLEQYIRDGMKAGTTEFTLRILGETDSVKVAMVLHRNDQHGDVNHDVASANVRLMGNVAIIVGTVPGVTANAGNATDTPPGENVS